MRPASEPAERRTGAPFSPESSGSSGGSHRATVRPAAGEPSSLTATTSRPVRRSAKPAGSATVAEASTSVGRAPYRAQMRSSRRSSRATCDPNSPR
jgi:hypothetical protein